MVSFNVKPAVRVHGPIDNPTQYEASVTASTTHKDLDLSVKVTDKAVRDGLKKDGITFTVEKKKAFKIEYELRDDRPTFTFDSSANVSDKTVKLKYKASPKAGGASSLEASVALDDKHTATATYTTTNFSLSHRNVNLKWSYAHNDDLTIEPEFNLGTEKAVVTATYKLDKDSKVKATYTQASDDVAVSYTNTAIAGERSEVVAKVHTNINDIAPRVSLAVERTFEL